MALGTKKNFQIHRGVLKIGKVLGQSLGHFWEKITQWHSQEDIWPKEFSNSMQGLKSAILAIFSERAGMAVPCYYGPQESLAASEKIFLV